MASDVVAPYSALAAVYDRWTAENDYGKWVRFITDRFRAESEPVAGVLDLCCGTGLLTEMLLDEGFAVTGVDRSEPMLRAAGARVGDRAELVRAELPELPADRVFDAAVCTFDSVNYLATPEELAAALGAVAGALRPDGLFIFDVNTRQKLAELFGSSHYGDDRGDFAYIWRNRYDPEAHRTEFLITLFTQEGERFARSEERHVQRWYSTEELTAAARTAGFTVLGVYEDYSAEAATELTLRETWVLRRATGSAA